MNKPTVSLIHIPAELIPTQPDNSPKPDYSRCASGLLDIHVHKKILACGLLLALSSACSEPPLPGQSAGVGMRTPTLPTGKGAYPNELAAFREEVEASKLSYLKVTAHRESGTAPLESKFRGQPYWPAGLSYPTDPYGVPLKLLAQINFAQAPKLEGYPDKGILQLFISDQVTREQAWGSVQYDEQPFDKRRWFASLQDQRFFRVIYHRDPAIDRAAPQPLARLWSNQVLPVMGEARLTFEPRTEHILPTDFRFQRVFGMTSRELFSSFGKREEDVATRYINFAHEWSDAKIGGYANFVQGDPRESAPDEDWMLLMEIQSASPPTGVEVMWGDAGVGGLFIRRSDLERLDFSRVAYYWDNH